METTLHRQLKLLYALAPEKTEVELDGFRIDAVAADGELIEIQHASLSALRKKTNHLVSPRSKHRLRIVKPIITRRRVTTLSSPQGDVIRSRMSPKTCDWTELFMDLVHFCQVFPRKRLTLEALMIEVEEIRIDRVPRRRRGKRYQSVDIQLVKVCERLRFQTVEDLIVCLPCNELPRPFDTAALAAVLDRPRWFAQKVAYCLRAMGAIEPLRRRRNGHQYEWLLPVDHLHQEDSAA